MTTAVTAQSSVRSAHAAIAGYEYQFEKTAIELLKAHSADVLQIEGIEDVDLHSAGESQAVQVKYFAGQSYTSPKSLRDPILLMLDHFKTGARWSYVLHVHFGDFHAMPPSFDVAQLKTSLTLVSPKRGTIEFFKGVSDEDLEDFCARLEIVRGVSYEEQERQLISELRGAMHCDEDEAVALYVAKSREFVHSRAMNAEASTRVVSRQDLLDHLCVKDLLFDKWQMERLGAERYLAAQKRRLRAGTFHDPKKKRAFYVGLTEDNLDEIIDLCRSMATKHIGRLKNAQPMTVIVDGEAGLVRRLKIALAQAGVEFNDGHEDLEFQPSAFVELPIVNTRGAGDRISKSSFTLRLATRSSYERVDSSAFKIARLVSVGDERPWMAGAADQIFTLRHFGPAEYKQLMEDLA